MRKRPIKSNNFGCCTFGWPLECFQKTFEPSANVEGIGILFAVCDSCLANKPALSILRNHDDRHKTRQRWERIIAFSTHRLTFLLWKTNRNIVEDHYFDNQILLQGFSSIRTMTQNVSCWNTKFPCIIFFNELRASSLQFKRFIQTSFICSFLAIPNDKGLFSFTKSIALENKLKLSNFGRMLLHEIVCTFYSYWFRPKVATTETIDIIPDICCWWIYKLSKLNLTYVVLLHWIGAFKREGNNTVEKVRLNVFKTSIVVLYASLKIHTSAPNCMKLSGSICGHLIH